jgi:uncharacterized protein DUF1552
MMIITQKAIPRRTLLKGVGATLALPFLDAMVPALAAPSATKAPNRLAVVYLPNGVMMNDWTPEKEGKDYELKRILQPLAPFKDKMLILSGLALMPARAQTGENGGDHARGGTAYLTGIHPRKTEGADTEAGISMDQIAANEIGKHTQFASLEVCVDSPELLGQCEAGYTCAYMNSICWRNETTAMPMENRPRQLFERIFGDSDSTDPKVRLRRIQQDKSILDSVSEKANKLRIKVGANDQTKINEYLDAVRDVERRVQTAEEQSDRELPHLTRPTGIPDTFTDHAKLMFDLQVLALQTDLTRVATFMMGREFTFRTFREIGIPDGYHSLTHHMYNPEKMEKVVAIQTYHAKHFAYYLDKLNKTQDGDGSLLDHMTVLYGGGISDGNSHLHDNLATVVVGGASGQWKGGRHVRVTKDMPLSNLLLGMLGTVGIEEKKLGDSSGHLDLRTV